MSHFATLLIGADINGQLAPFHEFECTGQNDQYVQNIDRTADLQSEIDAGETLEEVLAGYGLEDRVVSDESEIDIEGDNCTHKYGYAVVQDGKLIKAVRRTNPNAKWDWYQVGGRYSGWLRLKEGATGEWGDKSWTNRNEADDMGRCDIARKGDIDIEGMRREAELSVREMYAKRDALLTVTFESWRQVYDRMVVGSEDEKALEKAREFYQSQPAVVALRGGFDNPFFDIGQLSRPLEQAVESARNSALCTYAVIKDGAWYERGSMGWWGMASNEMDADEWAKKFNELIDGLPDDTILSVVDCHI